MPVSSPKSNEESLLISRAIVMVQKEIAISHTQYRSVGKRIPF